MTHYFAPLYNPTVEDIKLGGEPWMHGDDIFGNNYSIRFPDAETLYKSKYMGWEIA